MSSSLGQARRTRCWRRGWQNALLLAAGFAPAWRESDLGAPELATVNQALDYMLAQQEPFPAVVDRRWNLLRANAGAGWLTAFLSQPSPTRASTGTINLAEWLMSPDDLRPLLVLRSPPITLATG